MGERQLLCVQREPVEAELCSIGPVLGALRISDIAGDGVVDATKVATDLVTAACAGSHLEQRNTHDIGAESCFELGQSIHFRAAFTLLHRAVDDAAEWRPAANEGEVGLVDVAYIERLLECARVFGRQREHEHAAGGAVQAMDGIDPLTDGVARQSESKDGSLVVASVNRETRGLVDHHDRVVPMEHSDGRRGWGLAWRAGIGAFQGKMRGGVCKCLEIGGVSRGSVSLPRVLHLEALHDVGALHE
jgi:hypothetical protein